MTIANASLLGLAVLSASLCARAESNVKPFVRAELENVPVSLNPSNLHLGVRIDRIAIAGTVGMVRSSYEYTESSMIGGFSIKETASQSYLFPGLDARVYLRDVPEQGLVPFVVGSFSSSVKMGSSSTSIDQDGSSSSISTVTSTPSIRTFGAGFGIEYDLQRVSLAVRAGVKHASSESSTMFSKSISSVTWINTGVSAAYNF